MFSRRLTEISNTHWAILLIISAGVVLRFIHQFCLPVFNIDELSLGINIYKRDATGLLYPLDNLQSSPPLFLVLEKWVILFLPIPVWASIKALSFIASVWSLLLFSRLLKSYELWTSVIALTLFAFNPYIIFNSLTVKQYTIDLLGILILVNFYRGNSFQKYLPLYFMFWCLMSNVGLFGCIGYLLFRFANDRNWAPKNWLAFLKTHWLTALAPVPYLIYYWWFMQQPGASELKAYMLEFWSSSFIPLDAGFFKHVAYLFHSIWICMFNAYEVLGFLLLCVCCFGIFRIVTRKSLHNKAELGLLFAIIMINIALNVMQLYPFSGRIFLYTTPLYLLLFAASFHELIKGARFKTAIASVIALALIGTYSSYLFNKDNNLVQLYSRLEDLDNGKHRTFYGSVRAIDSHQLFETITENHFTKNRPITLLKTDDALEKANYLISRASVRFGPGDHRAAEEDETVELLKQHKIEFVDTVYGFNIYKIKR